MSKRSGSSIPLTVEKSGSRRRTDSPVSKSGSSSVPHDKFGHDLLAPTPLSYASPITPSLGPASSVGEDDLHEWQKDYSLLSAVALRIPGLSERASNNMPYEIAIYEAFFEYGFRGDVPLLIADLCSFFQISPSQLNPPTWRILIAIQNMSDEEHLPLGVNEELPKNDRKGLSFGKKWQERYVFVTLPGSHYLVEFRRWDSSCPRWSPEVLRHSRFRDDTAGGGVEDPMTAFKRSADAISVKRGVIDTNASDDEVMITGSYARTYDGFSGVLADLNAKVFPQDQTLLPDEDPSEVIQTIQGGLHRTLSQLNQLGDRLLERNLSSDREEKEELSRQISEEKSKRVAKELELRDLQAKVKAIEGSVEISSAEALKLSHEKQELGEALAKPKAEVEASEDMRVMAVNGTKITTLWEVMRELLNGEARKWDVAKEFDQFKTVVLAEAKFKGVDPPSFEDGLVIPPFLDMDVDPTA
ncbi:hypothetical protein Bca4012_063806 [Brassica carinata]